MSGRWRQIATVTTTRAALLLRCSCLNEWSNPRRNQHSGGPTLDETLKYLAGYPEHVQARVRELIAQDRLGRMLAEKYGQAHAVRSDGQLRDYVQTLKDRHLRKSVPLGKVIYDSKLQVMKHAL